VALGTIHFGGGTGGADTDHDGSFQSRLLSWDVAFKYALAHFPVGAGIEGPSAVFNLYYPNSPSHVSHSIYFQILGDNGFMGLGIYLTMLAIGFLNCQRIRKATRKEPALSWAYDLATMMQLSLVAFCVGGAALSLAYYDMPFILMALLSRLSTLVYQSQAEPRIALPAVRPALSQPAYLRTS
jgi:probable O-glycosylation ligase (exosortase A-associated)